MVHETEIVRSLVIVVGVTSIYFLTALSGGAGMLIRPFLMVVLGLPPALAIGTARIAHFGARLTGIAQFHALGRMNWRVGGLFLFPAVIGGVLGSFLTASLDAASLTHIMGGIILLVGSLLLLKPALGVCEQSARIDGRWRMPLVSLSFVASNFIAAIAGGAGILSTYALIVFRGETYTSAASIRAVAGLGGAVASAVGFVYLDLVSWADVPTVFCCAALGNFLGVRWGLRRGEHTVRYLTLCAVFAGGARMVFF